MAKKDSGKTTAAPADQTEKAAKKTGQKPASATKAPAKKAAAQKPASEKKTAPQKSGAAQPGTSAQPAAQPKAAVSTAATTEPETMDGAPNTKIEYRFRAPEVDDFVTVVTETGDHKAVVSGVHAGMRIDAVIMPIGEAAYSLGTIPHQTTTKAKPYWKHTK